MCRSELSDPARINGLLDLLEIFQIDHTALRRGTLRSALSILTLVCAGVLGELLSPADETFVQLQPLRRFLKGEIVAFKAGSGLVTISTDRAVPWQDGEGKMRYGAVVSDQRDQFEALGKIAVRETLQSAHPDLVCETD